MKLPANSKISLKISHIIKIQIYLYFKEIQMYADIDHASIFMVWHGMQGDNFNLVRFIKISLYDSVDNVNLNIYTTITFNLTSNFLK